jgi:hypothetical protein
MLRTVQALLLSLCIAFAGVMPAAASQDFQVSIQKVGSNGRITTDGARVEVTFSGTATTKYSSCDKLYAELGSRLKFELTVDSETFGIYVYETGSKVLSVTPTALKCAIHLSPRIPTDRLYEKVMPGTLSALVDDVVSGDLAVGYQRNGLYAPAPEILNPLRGATVPLEFDVDLDAVSDLSPYKALSFNVCPIEEESCSATKVLQGMSAGDEITLGQVVELEDYVFAKAISPTKIRVILAKAGHFTISVSRTYEYPNFNTYKVENEVLVSAKGSGFEDPTRVLTPAELAPFKVSGFVSCDGNSGSGSGEVAPGGTARCALTVNAKPAIAGRLAGTLYVGYNGAKPTAFKALTGQINSDVTFAVTASKAASAQYIRVYFVPAGLQLDLTQFATIEIVRPIVEDPKKKLTLRVSGKSTVAWGEVFTVKVSSTPAVSGTCKFYTFYGVRQLAATAKLSAGSSSAKIKALFSGAIGTRTTFSVTAVCTSGIRTGTGYLIVNGYR